LSNNGNDKDQETKKD